MKKLLAFTVLAEGATGVVLLVRARAAVPMTN